MSTNNHTAISSGAAANAGTINTPLGALDAAIGNLTSLTTADKASTVAAINEVDAHADAATAAVGTLASLETLTKTSVVVAINDVWKGIRTGATYAARGGIRWNPTTKILTLLAPIFIMHGLPGTYLSFTSDVTLDFGAATSSSVMYAYIEGVTVGTSQVEYSTANIKTEFYNAGYLSRRLADPDIIVIATFDGATNQVNSPFFPLGGRINTQLRAAAAYEARGGISWNPATEILVFSPTTYIYHGRDDKYLSFTSAITLDYSGYAAGTMVYSYVSGVTPDVTQGSYSTANIATETFGALSRDLSDPDIYVLATYNTTAGVLQSPFFPTGTPTESAETALDVWRNQYPNLSTKLAPALIKMMAPTDDFKIVLWGDSIFARENHTSAGTIDPTALPPGLITRNIAWYLWDQLPMRKGLYRRYDYTGAYFTETGTWATSLTGDNTANGGPDTAWDDELDRPTHTRISDAATAAFSWTLGVTDDESGCNLIYRTDTNGDAAATIAVTEGNGYLEYWTGAAWAEANGATFSMLEADEGVRRGNTIYNKRLKLRKTTAHESDSVTVTVGKATADADRLLYWGVELYDEINGKFIPQLINSARGSHTLNTGGSNIYDYMDDDVLDQAPDLVIFEIPLLNMIGEGGATKTSILNSVQDVIWGDRGGATNTWNLKTISSDWTDFQVLVVIPHHSQSHYTITTNVYVEPIADLNYLEIYNAVKALIIGKAAVAMIDMATAFEREIDASIYAGDYYTALDGSTATGASYTSDDVHPNNTGVLVYARHICPVLDAASF